MERLPPALHPIVGAVVDALARVDLAALVVDALPPRPPARARVRVLAVGKASPAMATGALARWPARVDELLVVAPDETPVGRLADGLPAANVRLLRAAHPLPDARSAAAAEAALALARGGASDLLLVLLSGGASSLLCAPSAGVSLAQARDVSRALLASGEGISAINTVRRHLSRIKGGGLTRAAAPGRVLALVASDVIGGEDHDVGSGPTLPDPTTVDDARRVAERVGLGDLPFVETLKAGDAPARRQRAKTILSPAAFARGVSRILSQRGLSPFVLVPSNEPAEALARDYLARARALGPGEALVRAAEPAVTVRGPASSRGGRCAHLAAMLARDLPAGVVFAAIATDGVDGSSGASGALVDRALGERAAGGWARVDAAIASFDTGPLHAEAGTAIALGPTGMNLADLHVLARLEGV